MYDINALRREEFPISADYIYFNHASISPLPTRTRNKMQWATGRLAEHPLNHFMEDGLPMFTAFNENFARYINAEHPHEIVAIPSTSTGINLIAQALPFGKGDNIIFADMEFPSNAYPWMSLERDGIEARQVKSVGGGLTLEALQAAADANTKLVAASAVQFFSGHRTDLAAIGQFCRERGIFFVVDAIQAAGHIKIDVQAMKIDAVVSGGQKSLLAAPGVGFMYVRDALASILKPRSIGANATKDYMFWLNYDLTPADGAARLNSGTPNVAGMFALVESLNLINELGVENIDQHTTGLAAEMIEQLAGLGYQVVTPREEHSAIVTFNSGRSAEETDKLVMALNEQRVSIVKHLDKNGVPHLRASFHCYNTRDEIHQFIEILKGY